MPEYTGTHQGHGIRFGIVVSRFNSFITDRLLDGALSALHSNGVVESDITVVFVPGAFELPLAAKRLAQSGSYDAVLCLGCVIRGETDHYEHIAGAATRGVMDASLETGVPVLFGVLTTDTVEQARARAGADGNKGAESALAGLEMATLLRSLCPEGGKDR